MMTRTALISVWNKSGIEELANRLTNHGFRLLSTGGTAVHLRDRGLEVTDVANWTGSAELLDGRVKTLHPRIHAAILADRDDERHMEALADRDIEPIDLVVCNLYPFTDAAAAPQRDDATDEIDIGGSALLRAAAKNCAHVAVVTDTNDYGAVAQALDNGGLDEAIRRRLAATAFRRTAAYDAAIARYFGDADAFPDERFVDLRLERTLRYGENPHQRGALYREAGDSGPPAVEKLHGKTLSYNNLVDLEAALQLIWEFEAPAAAIIKHTNPTGCAVDDAIEDAFARALAGDPMSAFGGIVAVNRRVTEKLADQLREIFVEIVAAPDFSAPALDVLTNKKNVRLMQWDEPQHSSKYVRSSALGWLVQSADPPIDIDLSHCDVPTERSPNARQRADMALAWRVVKHVKSNAIVLAKDQQIIGVGAGQMSRVDAVHIAVEKCVAADPDGAVLASDAFFPFRDGPDRAAEAGVEAIVQPGGSRRDDEVIDACDEHGVAMVMTGMRHFRHG